MMAKIWLSSLLGVFVFNLTAEAQQVEVKNGNATFTTNCEELQMTVTVEVERDFKGKIYVQNHESSCPFLQDATDSSMYNRSFDYQLTDCGQTTTTNTANNTREFSVSIVVQYSPDVVTSADTIHKSVCVFEAETSVGSQSGTVNRSDASLGQSESSAAGDTSALLEFDIEDEEGTDMNNFQVSVGRKLFLVTGLLSNSIFTEMLVKNCRASNRANNSDSDYVSVALLDDSGCPANASVEETLEMEGPAYQSFNDSQNPSRRNKLGLNSFLFVKGKTASDTNQLVFSCDVLLCPPDNTAPCDFNIMNCPRQASPRRRRSVDQVTGFIPGDVQTGVSASEEVRERRSAGQDTKLTSVQGSIQVISHQESSEGPVTAKPSTDSERCLQNGKTQAILVAMGVLLLALLLVVITLVVLLCRRRRRVVKAKQADDGLSMGYSRQTLAPDHVTKYRG